jgi:hypothetical protein
MANRQTTPHQVKTVALCLIAAVLSAPAIAAPSRWVPCSEVAQANLEVPVRALIIQRVSNDVPVSSMSFLAPRAEAAIRDAFRKSDSALAPATINLAKATPGTPMTEAESKPIASTNEDDSDNSVGPIRELNTRLPGVSDDTLSRYKKQMYRRDI